MPFCFILHWRAQQVKEADLSYTTARDVSKLSFNFNASLTSVNLAKVLAKEKGIPFSMASCKTMIHNAYLLERFICVSGIKPGDMIIIARIFAYKMGLQNHQWIACTHKDTGKPHIHLIANRIGIDSKVFDTTFMG